MAEEKRKLCPQPPPFSFGKGKDAGFKERDGHADDWRTGVLGGAL